MQCKRFIHDSSARASYPALYINHLREFEPRLLNYSHHVTLAAALLLRWCGIASSFPMFIVSCTATMNLLFESRLQETIRLTYTRRGLLEIMTKVLNQPSLLAAAVLRQWYTETGHISLPNPPPPALSSGCSRPNNHLFLAPSSACFLNSQV